MRFLDDVGMDLFGSCDPFRIRRRPLAESVDEAERLQIPEIRCLNHALVTTVGLL